MKEAFRGSASLSLSKVIEDFLRVYSENVLLERERRVRESVEMNLDMYINNLLALTMATALFALASTFVCLMYQRMMYKRLTEVLEAVLLMQLFNRTIS